MKINNYELKCGHCGGGNFTRRQAQLNTKALTFFDLDFLNPSADVFICDRCGHLEWFVGAKISAHSDQAARDCPNCSFTIPAEEGICPNCGTAD